MSDCKNDPGKEKRRQDAICHICKKYKSCGFCNLCCHWFCRVCNLRIFKRSIAAVKQLVKGSKPGCCGPQKRNICTSLETCKLKH